MNEKTNPRYVSVTIKLPLSEKKELDKLAEKNDRSLSWIGAKVIKSFLGSEQTKKEIFNSSGV